MSFNLYEEAGKIPQSMDDKHSKAALPEIDVDDEMKLTEIAIVDMVCDVLDSWISSSSSSDLGIIGKFREAKLRHYLHRMYACSGASASCFVVALEYLERFQKRHPSIKFNNKSFQRLLLVAVMTSAKFLEDATISNSNW
jgi:hypothetical protein